MNKPIFISLHIANIQTPIGELISLTSQDTNQLVLLSFSDYPKLDLDIKLFCASTIRFGANNKVSNLVTREITLYFEGRKDSFTFDVFHFGTNFAIEAWSAIYSINYGTTKSYKKLAESIDMPNSYRAIARVASANKLAIVIPCHRVIGHQGGLGGYKFGLERKMWLLEHEKSNKKHF